MPNPDSVGDRCEPPGRRRDRQYESQIPEGRTDAKSQVLAGTSARRHLPPAARAEPSHPTVPVPRPSPSLTVQRPEPRPLRFQHSEGHLLAVSWDQGARVTSLHGRAARRADVPSTFWGGSHGGATEGLGHRPLVFQPLGLGLPGAYLRAGLV